MAINQLSTSNTFQQWLIATQILIERSNFFQDTSNATLDAANTTLNLYPIILSSANDVSNNTILTSNNTEFVANTANIIFDYVETSFDVANTVLEISLESYDHTNAAFDHANAAYDHANSAFDKSNLAFEEATSAFEHANSSHIAANNSFETANASYNQSNIAYELANTSYNIANSFLDYLANNANLALVVDDVTTDNDNRYILFSEDTGVLLEANISKTKLYYNPSTGTISATNFNSLSDQNLKKNVVYIDNAIDTIQKLNGVSFDWVDTDKKSYGLIAQELEKVLPELVEGSEKKTVNYSGLIAFLINAVKDLNNRVVKLESLINKE